MVLYGNLTVRSSPDEIDPKNVFLIFLKLIKILYVAANSKSFTFLVMLIVNFEKCNAIA